MDPVIRSEILRKCIHLSCVLFPLIYLYWLSKEQIVVLCGLITCGFILAEVLRFKSDWGQKLFKFIFTPLLREGEKGRTITGATFLFMALTVTFLIFSKKIAVAAVLILTIADSLAAIFGKRYGTRRFFDKTWQGSSVFYICTVMILLVIFPEMALWALLVALPVTFLEALPLPVNDNLLIPLFSGVVLTLAGRLPL
jgi:dolichol kinase